MSHVWQKDPPELQSPSEGLSEECYKAPQKLRDSGGRRGETEGYLAMKKVSQASMNSSLIYYNMAGRNVFIIKCIYNILYNIHNSTGLYKRIQVVIHTCIRLLMHYNIRKT